MSLRALYPDLDRILAAAGLAQAAGVQLFEAAPLLALHHPPLNPDWPAVLALGNDSEGAALTRLLRAQYPADHRVWWVLRTAGDQLEALAGTIGGLAEMPDHPGERPVALVIPALPQPSSFERFQEIIAHLRAPEGCPWDRKQTHASLRPYLLEEAYEVLDALDAGNAGALAEELGDLLLQIVLHSQIAVEAGEFRMADVLAHIIAKIIRRHPHVWGEVSVNDEHDVKANWDRLKQAEKQRDEGRQSRLDGVPKSLPALSQAFSYQDRAARVRFDWDTIEPVIAKVHEEIAELHAASEAQEREREVGDLLFAVVNWARWLGVEPESALRGANARFYRRFHFIEQHVTTQGRALEDLSLEEMDAIWEAAKAQGL